MYIFIYSLDVIILLLPFSTPVLISIVVLSDSIIRHVLNSSVSSFVILFYYSTKGKTDALKAKTRTLFGKKIIMAVKAGGPDQVNNKALADVIRQAKASNVPADVSILLNTHMNNHCDYNV